MKNEKTTKVKSTTTRKSVVQAMAKQDKEKAISKDTPEVQEAIRLKAYEIFMERGGTQGSDLEDWLIAERIVLAKSK